MAQQTITFPPRVQARISALKMQAESLEAQLQQLVDGYIFGAGVDVDNNSITVDLGAMTATITPKEQGEEPFLSLPESAMS